MTGQGKGLRAGIGVLLGGLFVLTLSAQEITTMNENPTVVVGTFDSREVKLRPGRYTAVGTRNGYRDVRREFMVHTDRATQPVVLRCEEERRQIEISGTRAALSGSCARRRSAARGARSCA